jgi:hypothetical protein
MAAVASVEPKVFVARLFPLQVATSSAWLSKLCRQLRATSEGLPWATSKNLGRCKVRLKP